MRIPTNEEYDQMLVTTYGTDEKIHWVGMYSWVNNTETESGPSASTRTVCGFYMAGHREILDATLQCVYVGFRPAFEIQEVDILALEGELSIIGTLYMDGQPVNVAQNPAYSGDVTAYVPGTKLEVRPPLGDPAYIVTGYRVGDVVVADRALLRNISYNDIVAATQGGKYENSYHR